MPEETKSLASGHKLDQQTFDDFVQRLRHDCVGAGVREHCTANALFIVQARRIVGGIDTDYTDQRVVLCEDREWFSPQEYWDDLDDEERAELNRKMQVWSECQFMKADEDDQWHVLGELENHTVTGWSESWEYVSAHFTKDAAEAFIRRKKHDYRHGMRVYVESQYYAWEFNVIKNAILDGRLILAPAQAAAA
ncbi:hypothetical protein D9M68_276680 [compost metagenome]